MKKYLLFIPVIIFYVHLLAQDEIIIKGSGAVPISKAQTPEKVISKLEQDFPDAQAIKYFKVTPEMVKKWAVTEEDNLQPGEKIDHYTISFTRDDVKYYGLYDADGNLLMSKFEQKEVNLPDAVKTSLKKLGEGKGYKLVSKSYYKTTNHNKNKEYYEVTASNGKKTKKVIVDPSGNVIKIK